MRTLRRLKAITVRRGIGVFVVLCCASAFAQTHPSPGPPPIHPGQPGQMPGQNPNAPPGTQPPQHPMPEFMQSRRQDKLFIREAIQGNLGEIDLAKLALEKSSNTNVRQFAERMVSDHTRMNNQMELIAHRLQVDIPTEPGKNSRKQKKKLESLSEPQFDRSYAKAMVKDHENDLHKYQRESTSAQDPQLRNAAAQGSGIIRQHLSMAEKLQKSQKPVSGASS